MAKNRRDQKRRQQKKALERRTARRRAAKLKLTSKKNKGPSLNAFSEEDQMFWVGHGANYLASDYENGVWDPIVEEIYNGTPLTIKALSEAVLKRYQDNDGDVPPSGKAVITWTVQDRSTIYLFARKALRAIKKNNPDTDADVAVRQPKNPLVWEIFQGIKAKF